MALLLQGYTLFLKKKRSYSIFPLSNLASLNYYVIYVCFYVPFIIRQLHSPSLNLLKPTKQCIINYCLCRSKRKTQTLLTMNWKFVLWHGKLTLLTLSISSPWSQSRREREIFLISFSWAAMVEIKWCKLYYISKYKQLIMERRSKDWAEHKGNANVCE